ncbi:MAG: efflux RND transporter permease subunit [Pirellulaceae bacterium]
MNSRWTLVVLLAVAGWLLGLGQVMAQEDNGAASSHAPVQAVHYFVIGEWPGHEPAEMEQLITIPLEKQLDEIAAVERVGSITSNGHTAIWVRFGEELNSDQRGQMVNEQLQTILPSLPVDASVSLRRPANRWLLLGFSADTESMRDNERMELGADLRATAQALRARIARISHVADITIHGGTRERWRVVFDRDKMTQRNVSFGELVTAIRSLQGTEDGVQGVPESTSLESLAQLAVRPGEAPVLLTDVAEVRNSWPADLADDPNRYGLSSVMGMEHAVIMAIGLDDQADLAEFNSALAKELELAVELLPEGATVHRELNDEFQVPLRRATELLGSDLPAEFQLQPPAEATESGVWTSSLNNKLTIKFTGPDHKELLENAESMVRQLTAMEGTLDIHTRTSTPRPKLTVNLDQQKLDNLGITANSVHEQLNVLRGHVVARLRGENRFVDVVLKPQNETPGFVDLSLRAAHGMVPLTEVAEVSFATAPGEIYRENLQRLLVIEVGVDEERREEVLAEVRRAMQAARVEMEEGYFCEVVGNRE